MTLTTTPSQGRHRVVEMATQHPLGTFVVLAYLLSWSAFIPAALTGADGLIMLGAFGPAVAAALVTRWTGGSVKRWLRSLLYWRVPARFYLIALGLPPLLIAATNLELWFAGHAVRMDSPGKVIPQYLGTLIAVALLGGGQEEPGWRGFALARFQARHSPLVATALLGVVWGAWHLPVYGLAGFAGPLLFIVFYTWLYNRTGSVLLSVLLHASFNTSVGYLKLDKEGAIVSVVLVLTVVAATGGLIAWTKGRLGVDRPPHLQERQGVPDQARNGGFRPC